MFASTPLLLASENVRDPLLLGTLGLRGVPRKDDRPLDRANRLGSSLLLGLLSVQFDRGDGAYLVVPSDVDLSTIVALLS